MYVYSKLTKNMPHLLYTYEILKRTFKAIYEELNPSASPSNIKAFGKSLQSGDIIFAAMDAFENQLGLVNTNSSIVERTNRMLIQLDLEPLCLESDMGPCYWTTV